MLKIGHRGAPGHTGGVGENTIGSFRKALWSGADAIEFDVRRTKDGKLVVIHDATLDRTTNGKGKVADMDYYEFNHFDAGYGWGVPLLKDVFTHFEKTPLLFFIESKEKELVGDIIMLAAKFGLEQRIILLAFDSDDCDRDSNSSWKELAEARAVVPIGLLASVVKVAVLGKGGFIEAAKNFRAMAVCTSAFGISEDLVKIAHEKDLVVYVYLLSEVEPIFICGLLKTLGVDGIISDSPNLL